MNRRPKPATVARLSASSASSAAKPEERSAVWGAVTGGSLFPGTLDGAEHGLVVPVGHAQEFIMVDFDDERDFVRVFPAHDAQYAIGGGNAVAAAFNGQLYDVFRIEINRVGGKRGTAAVLNALINREDGAVTRS